MFQALSHEIEKLKTVNIQQDLTINRLLEFIGQNNVLDIGELFKAKITRRLFTGMSCGESQIDTTENITFATPLVVVNFIANSLWTVKQRKQLAMETEQKRS